MIGRQCAKRGEAAALDQHVPISEVAEVDPSAAFLTTLPNPLKPVAALNHAVGADTDNGGIAVVAFSNT
jgi:hypothetical protein